MSNGFLLYSSVSGSKLSALPYVSSGACLLLVDTIRLSVSILIVSADSLILPAYSLIVLKSLFSLKTGNSAQNFQQKGENDKFMGENREFLRECCSKFFEEKGSFSKMQKNGSVSEKM